MAITNSNDSSHIVRTSAQWKSSYDSYDTIPLGVLCVELIPDGSMKIKIGDGHNTFAKLPYVGGQAVSDYYSKRETDERIKAILKEESAMRIRGVLSGEAALPSNPAVGDVYFVLSRSSSSYIEYVYATNHSWIPIGGTPVDSDLSGYATQDYVNEQIDEVNTRIDEIVKGGTSSHLHDNKDILDSTTASFTKEDKAKLDSMSSFTSADRDKLNVLIKNSTSFEKIAALEKLAHEHSNKRILDRTTASFTTDYEQKMKWIRPYTGAENGYEGIMGLVPPAQPGEEEYVLNGAGEWVPMEGGGEAAELTPATTSKLGGVIVGKGLKVDQFGILSTEENENNCDCDNVGHFDRTSGTPGTGEIFNSYSGMYMNKATGQYSHAEGVNANASGYASHAEGMNTKVEADHAHVEGQGHHIHKNSDDSHAEGADNEIFARAAHAEGQGHKVYGENAHAEGWDTDALGPRSHTEGYQTSAGVYDESYPSAAHAEGIQTTAVSQGSHAEGYKSYAGLLPKRISSDNDGYYAHAEGNHTYAYGHASHAEGNGTTASGKNAHSEGGATTASGQSSHAEGIQTTASGEGSHSEGETTTASGGDSHAEGYNTTASGNRSHTEGMSTKATSDEAHAEGIGTTASGNYSHAEGSYTNATKDSAHSEGYGGRKITDVFPNFSSSTSKDEIVAAWGTSMTDGFTLANGMGSHAEGFHTLALDASAHAEGDATHALGKGSHSEGHVTKAVADDSHAEGDQTVAKGQASHAEGFKSTTLGQYAHAEGCNTTADGYNHSEGVGSYTLLESLPSYNVWITPPETIIEAWNVKNFTLAKGNGSHAEGQDTLAIGQASHAEGFKTRATSLSAHSEGRDTKAEGYYSHAEGMSSVVSGDYSHAQGNYTIANGGSQFTLGKFNIPDNDEKYAVIIGGGTADNNRKNIFTVDWSGNIELGVSDADGNITYGTINGVDITNITVNGVTDINESEENNTITVVFSDGTSKDITIKCNGGSSETPIATTETPGIVKPGKGLEVLDDGTLNVIVDTNNSNVGGYNEGEAIYFTDKPGGAVSKSNPIMTSYNTPEGQVIYSGEYSGRPAYGPFYGTDSKTWDIHSWSDNVSVIDGTPDACYDGYLFGKEVTLSKFIISFSGTHEYTAVIQVHTTNGWQTVVDEFTIPINYNVLEFTIDPITCDGFRCSIISSINGNPYFSTTRYGSNICNFEAWGTTISKVINVKYGDGLTIDENGYLVTTGSAECKEYIAGTGITMQDVTTEVGIDVWKNGDKWSNIAYENKSSNNYVSYAAELHSSVANEDIRLYPILSPTRRLKYIKYDINGNPLSGHIDLYNSNCVKYSDLGWADDNDAIYTVPGDAEYIAFAIRRMNHTSAMYASEVKSVDIVWLDMETSEKTVTEISLNPATQDTIGGVKPGNGLEILEDGTLNVTVEGGSPIINGIPGEGYVIKSLTYTGTGGVNNIEFPEKPIGIISISGLGKDDNWLYSAPTSIDSDYMTGLWGGATGPGQMLAYMSFDEDTNILTLIGKSHRNDADNFNMIDLEITCTDSDTLEMTLRSPDALPSRIRIPEHFHTRLTSKGYRKVADGVFETSRELKTATFRLTR